MKSIFNALLCLFLILPQLTYADSNRCLGVGRGETVYSSKFRKSYFRELEGLLEATHHKKDAHVIREAVQNAKKEVSENLADFKSMLSKIETLFSRSEKTLCQTQCSYSEVKQNQLKIQKMSENLLNEINGPAHRAGLKVSSWVKFMGLSAILGAGAFYTTNAIHRITQSIYDGGSVSLSTTSTTLALGTVSIITIYALSKGIKAVYSETLARPAEPYLAHFQKFFMKAVGNRKTSEAKLGDMLQKLFYESERTLSRVEIKLRDRLVEIYRASWSELKNIVKDFNGDVKRLNLGKKSINRPLEIESYHRSYRVLVTHTANWLVRISNLYPELLVRLQPSKTNPSGLNPILISIFSPIFAKIRFTKNGLYSENPIERALEQSMRSQFVVHVMNAAVTGAPNRILKQSDAPAYKSGDKYVFPEKTQGMKLTGNFKAIESMLIAGLKLPDYTNLDLNYKNSSSKDALSDLLNETAPE